MSDEQCPCGLESIHTPAECPLREPAKPATDETMLGPATSLSHLTPTEACVVIADETGALFVRAATDEDVVELVRRESRG